MPEIAKIRLGAISDFKIQTIKNTGDIATFKKNTNTVIYIPEPTDSVVTGNESTKTKITINGIDVFNIDN